VIGRAIYKLGLDRRKDPYAFYLIGRRDVMMVHIPKTAGTSIRNTLGMYPARKARPELGFKQHLTAKEIISIVGKPQWDQAFTFAMVRNPWDRMVSNYHYRKKKIGFVEKGWDIAFSDYVHGAIGQGELPYDPSSKFLMPQVEWLKDEQGEICVDFIGRYESVQSDFKSIKKKARRWAPDLFTHNQSTRKRDYKDYYDADTKKLVADFYKSDIEFFGYGFT